MTSPHQRWRIFFYCIYMTASAAPPPPHRSIEHLRNEPRDKLLLELKQREKVILKLVPHPILLSVSCLLNIIVGSQFNFSLNSLLGLKLRIRYENVLTSGMREDSRLREYAADETVPRSTWHRSSRYVYAGMSPWMSEEPPNPTSLELRKGIGPLDRA